MNKNLIPANTRENFKEISRKGGIASGKARRKKADLRKKMELLLSLETNNENNKKLLEKVGLDDSNESLLVFQMLQKAISGNQKAVENILKLIGTKDKYDIQEQKARIKNASKSEVINNNINFIGVDDVAD